MMFRKVALLLLVFSLSLTASQQGVLAAPGSLSMMSSLPAVAGASAWNAAGDSGQLPLPERPQRGIQIRLQQAVFDPLREPPSFRPELRADEGGSASGDYHLVQMRGPILADWRAALEAHGAEILDYVPDFAYIVRADAAILGRLQSLNFVRWTGAFEPAFRVSNDLLGHIDSGRGDVAVELIVRGFAGEPADRLGAELAGRSVAIEAQYEDQGGGALFRALVTEAQIAELAHVPGIAWIEPRYEPAFANSLARSSTIMNKNLVEAELGLFGEGQVVGVGDSGLSTGNAATVHMDFAGRVVGGSWGSGTCGSWADNHSHGTHVAGSVLGSGARSGADIPNQNYAGSHAGIAPEASLYVWSFCNDFSGLPNAPYDNYYGAKYAVDPNLRISTNSWEYSSGFGQYNSFTRETDRFIRDFPDLVVTYAAGNNARDSNSNGVINLGSMAMPSTAKNVITVGASESLRMSGGLNPGGSCSTWGSCWPSDFPVNPINSDRISDNIDGMAAFSGRGPTLSGRLKPDVVAPGTNIVSARNESTGTGWGVFDAYYLYSGGTSMATPLVAGAAAIIREFFDVEHQLNPSAALVKAMLINGAVNMTPGQYGTGTTQEIIRRPDNSQGWGRVSMTNTLLFEGPRVLHFEEHAGLATGQTHELVFEVADTSLPLRVSLVWTDMPGTEASHGALVNDLDLEVTAPGGIVIIGNAPITGGPPDRDNNVEGIDLVPSAGRYTVTVRGFNVPSGPQPFALVVTGGLGEVGGFELEAEQDTVAICSGQDAVYALGVLSLEDFDDEVSLSLSGLPGGASAVLSPNPVVPADPAAAASLSISSTGGLAAGSYPLTVTGQSDGPGSGPREQTLALQLRVDTEGPDAPTLVSPANGASSQAPTLLLSWAAGAGALEYELEVATDPGFSDIVVQITTTATGHLVSLDPETTYYWRVRAANACGGSDDSAVFSFSTAAAVCSAPGSAIPTGGSVSDAIVLGSGPELTDLRLSLQLQWAWVGDLVVTLEHVESGTVIDLLNRPGVSDGSTYGCGSANIDVLFDDGADVEANTLCNDGPPAINGIASPVGSLADFAGELFSGEWILTVIDTQGIEEPGTLTEWCLIPEPLLGVPVALGFSLSPSYGIVGGPLMPSVVVQVVDSVGDLVADDNSTVVTLDLAVNPHGAAMSGTLSMTVSNGEAHFTDLSLDQVGSGYQLLAADAAGELATAESALFDVRQDEAFEDRFEE